MWYKGNDTTFRWVIFWVLITLMLACLTEETRSLWAFITVIISFLILLCVTIHSLVRAYRRSRIHQNPFKDIRYHIPQFKYTKRNFVGAPDAERQPDTLTVGVGQYRIMLVLVTRANLVIRNLYPLQFEGSQNNMPVTVSFDNPFIVEEQKDIFVDWWGNKRPPFPDWLQNFARDDFRIVGYRVHTTGNWKGKVLLEFYLENIGKFYKRLEFCVSDIAEDDEIPFLKVQENEPKCDATGG